MNNSLKLETLCVQGGWQPKKGEPRVLPIYQSTTFKYDTSEQMAKLFDLEEDISIPACKTRQTMLSQPRSPFWKVA